MSDNGGHAGRRQQIAVRLAPTALAEVDRIATTHQWTRSQVLRELLRLGLDAYRKAHP